MEVKQQFIPRQEVQTISTSIVELLPIMNNRTRTSYVLTNTGTTAVTLGFGTDAVIGKGIVLQPQGVAQDTNSVVKKIWQGRVSALSTGAGSTIAVFEEVE